MDRIQAGERLRNPVEPRAASIENGKLLFQIYCALCHGPNATGGGPVASKFVPPPDLTLDLFRQRPDGFLYATIRDGGALMPGQGDALSPSRRSPPRKQLTEERKRIGWTEGLVGQDLVPCGTVVSWGLSP